MRILFILLVVAEAGEFNVSGTDRATYSVLKLKKKKLPEILNKSSGSVAERTMRLTFKIDNIMPEQEKN